MGGRGEDEEKGEKEGEGKIERSMKQRREGGREWRRRGE